MLVLKQTIQRDSNGTQAVVLFSMEPLIKKNLVEDNKSPLLVRMCGAVLTEVPLHNTVRITNTALTHGREVTVLMEQVVIRSTCLIIVQIMAVITLATGEVEDVALAAVLTLHDITVPDLMIFLVNMALVEATGVAPNTTVPTMRVAGVQATELMLRINWKVVRMGRLVS
jgi:hypothetical protein